MNIESTRFGTLEVTEEQIIRFPHGIPGFLNEKAFVLLPHGEDSPFYFLQSTSEADLCFLLVDPFAFIKDYEFELEDEVAQELELSVDNPPQVFSIATLKGKYMEMTVNLLAPIVINLKERMARQVILDNSKYSIRHKLFAEQESTDTSEGGA